jgi:hypothetical protein
MEEYVTFPIKDDHPDEPELTPDLCANEYAKFRTYSMSELDGLDLDIDYILRNALVADTPGVFGGREKSLKTMIAIDCAVSVATGTKWLGFFEPVQSLRSIYFCGEGGLTFVRDAVRRIAVSKGKNIGDLTGFSLCDEVPNLSSEKDLREVAAVIRDQEALLVFFDPLYLMMADQAGQATNVFAMGGLFQRLLRACRDVGATPIVIHHFRKNSVLGGEPDLADLAQAGCAEFAGQWLLIQRQTPYDDEMPGEHDLIIRLGSRLGHSSKWALHVSEGTSSEPGGRYWAPEVSRLADLRARQKRDKEAANQRRQRERLDRNQAKILEAMADVGGSDTMTAIRSRAGLNPDNFQPAFAELQQAGKVVPCLVQKSNRRRPYDGFKLAE